MDETSEFTKTFGGLFRHVDLTNPFSSCSISQRVSVGSTDGWLEGSSLGEKEGVPLGALEGTELGVVDGIP
jgi:hypothetical protein